MRRTCVLLVSFVLATGLACGRKAEQDRIKTVEIDGVPTVLNPQEPLYPSAPWRFEETLVISNRDTDPDTSFTFVAHAAVAPGPRLYVIDSMTRKVQMFDAKGRFVRSLAHTGEGPGELLHPTSVDIDAEGNVYVLDGRLRRVSVFSMDGRFLKNIPTQTGHPLQSSVDSSGTVYLALLVTDRQQVGNQDMQLVRVDTTGDVVVDFGTFPYARITPIRKGNAVIFTYTGFEPLGHWQVSADGNLLVGYGDTYEISVYDRDGNLRRRIRREWQVQPISGAEKATVLKRFKDEAIRKRVVFPGHKPAYYAFLLDDLGNLWVRVAREEEPTYDVFDRNGRYVYRLRMPGRVLAFGQGLVVVLENAADGSLLLHVLRRRRLGRAVRG